MSWGWACSLICSGNINLTIWLVHALRLEQTCDEDAESLLSRLYSKDSLSSSVID